MPDLPALPDRASTSANVSQVAEAGRAVLMDRARTLGPATGVTPADLAVAQAHLDTVPASTLRAYQLGQRTFADWCGAEGVPYAFPDHAVTPEALAAFVDAMRTDPVKDRRTGQPIPDARDPSGFRTRKPATVRQYVAAVAAQHVALDLPSPASAKVVRDALSALTRAKGAAQRQARGLTRPVLDTALARLDGLGAAGSLIALRDAALLALAYDTAARSAEVAALDVADVAPDGLGGATATVRRSKTDQEGEGRDAYVAPDTWRRVKAWIAEARLDADDALFPPLGPRAVKDRLATIDVRRIFKRHLGDAYSGHSARVGQVQDALGTGLDVGATAQSGGWKDARMVLRYGRKALARRSAAAQLAQAQGRA